MTFPACIVGRLNAFDLRDSNNCEFSATYVTLKLSYYVTQNKKSL